MKSNKERENNPEEVISRGEQFAERHYKLILYIVLVIVVVALGIWAYVQYVSKPRAARAAAELFRSEELFINGADSAVLKVDGISEEGVLRIIDQYSGTDAANLSHLYAGIAYYDLKQYQEALSELKKFSAASGENMIAPSIVRLMGDCSVELEKLDDAVSYFQKAAKMADNEVVSPGCLQKAARVYEKQGKTQKAIDAYQTIIDKYYKATVEVEQAQAEIARLQEVQ